MKTILYILLPVLLIASCKKDSFITSSGALLYTSTALLSFDTVFTSVGSVTQSFKIFNSNEQKLRLSQVKLSGGASSPFKMNVDGTAATEVDNVEINAGDSLYVFVQVNVNPSASPLPFILSDSILIAYNGNEQWVQLQAYGRNALFLKSQTLKGNVNWSSDLPYVIMGGIQVDTGAVLTISAGTHIYLHADAPFLVDGTLKANGTAVSPIVFSGDRLEADYRDLPASWPGIFFRTASTDNILKYGIIKNAYQGIIAQGLPASGNPKVNLSQCVIDNIYDAGIWGINTRIYMDNSLISNCGSNVQVEMGGDYRLVNCTVASYGTTYIAHKNPVLQLSDFITQEGMNYTASLNAIFTNCIFWGQGGSVDDEIAIDQQGSEPLSAVFDHVLYKSKNGVPHATFNSSLQNLPPEFDTLDISKNRFDFHFRNAPASPAVNAGITTPFLYDLDGKLRDDGQPDIGCYER